MTSLLFKYSEILEIFLGNSIFLTSQKPKMDSHSLGFGEHMLVLEFDGSLDKLVLSL